jgi:uncharacterized protein YndB with AHSA1/START domain
MARDVAIDPELDLVLTREVDVPRSLLWEAWTRPEHVKKWFTPAPWQTVDCEMDLRPGGVFRTVMRSPEGEEFPNAGCFLEIVAGERLVWTDAMGPGYRPAAEPFMTAVVTFEDHAGGTRYTAVALHCDAAGRKKHEEMGFFEGWGKAFEQLVAVARSLAS